MREDMLELRETTIKVLMGWWGMKESICYHCVKVASCDDVIQAMDRDQIITKCCDYKSKYGGM